MKDKALPFSEFFPKRRTILPCRHAGMARSAGVGVALGVAIYRDRTVPNVRVWPYGFVSLFVFGPGGLSSCHPSRFMVISLSVVVKDTLQSSGEAHSGKKSSSACVAEGVAADFISACVTFITLLSRLQEGVVE